MFHVAGGIILAVLFFAFLPLFIRAAAYLLLGAAALAVVIGLLFLAPHIPNPWGIPADHNFVGVAYRH